MGPKPATEPPKPPVVAPKPPEKVVAVPPLPEVKSIPSKKPEKEVKNTDLTKAEAAKKAAADSAYEFDDAPQLEVRSPLAKVSPSAPKPVTSPPVAPKPVTVPVVKPKKVAAEKTPRKRPAPKPVTPAPEPTRESKRARVQASLYQSPDPELLQIIKQTKEESIKKEGKKVATPKAKSKPDEPASTAVFFKGEHLAVRNPEGSFYLCQANQNIYRHTKKIKIQWLGLAPDNNATKDLYLPEYYDTTEFLTILTSVELKRKEKKTFQLPQDELQRIEKILKKAFDKESGKLSENDLSLTEDNPDGLDISIYKDEDQLEELERKKKLQERKQK